MANININNLTFAYEGTYNNIFENVSLNLDTRWRLALIGRNGRGKTTFLKILTNELEYKGTVNSAVNFTYFPFEVPDENKTVFEIAEEVCPNAEIWQIERELNLLCVREDVLYREYKTLSGGEQTKILLSLMFLKENTFFLIDEPTNHLDLTSRDIVGEYLSRKKGFILVSHDRSLIDKCADHILSINKCDIEIIKGNFSIWQENTEFKQINEQKQNENLLKEIEKLNIMARRSGGWSDKLEATKFGAKVPDRGYIGAKSAKLMQQKKNAENRINRDIEAKKELLKNVERADDLKIISEATRAKKLVEFRDVSIFYEDLCVCKNINFKLNSGERLALMGINGSGKSSILKLILGQDIKYTGDIYINSGLKISYVSQDTIEESDRICDMSSKLNLNEPVFLAMLSKLGFESGEFTKEISSLSMGQKKKVLLAMSISENAHLYIWDEPLNYVDIISRIQIEEVIKRDKPTMIFVEHDRAFCEACATDISLVF